MEQFFIEKGGWGSHYDSVRNLEEALIVTAICAPWMFIATNFIHTYELTKIVNWLKGSMKMRKGTDISPFHMAYKVV